jgi:hypothetical protein
VTLNGLLLDGSGTGQNGIVINSGASVQILNSVVRQFGIIGQSSTSGSNLLIEDTASSDNARTGILVNSYGVKATLNRITSNNNAFGVATDATMTVANSVMSNNAFTGLDSGSGVVWLSRSVISGNGTGVSVGGTVNSQGQHDACEWNPHACHDAVT